jgi:glutamate N-acetyltransferase/amino-acid N-acetyltransferase
MSVVAARGFRAAGVDAGIKNGESLDLALVVSDHEATAAGTFTRNRAAAAPVQLCKAHLANGTARAIVCNSGVANAATGPQGDLVAAGTARSAAKVLGIDASDVLVCSTGLIGEQLDGPKVGAGIGVASTRLGDTPQHGLDAATAIMTTDTVPKVTHTNLDGWTIGGMSKGAGMIRPNMATMLGFITTDAVVSAETLQKALRDAVDVSFNSLDIDGAASTNDTVLALANGASGIEPDAEAFAQALRATATVLATKIAEDAEGARRLVTLRVEGAASDGDARTLGRAMCDSALVRSAFYGGDPNWGRLLSACGETDVEFAVDQFAVAYNGTIVAAEGVKAGADRAALRERLKQGPLDVLVRVGGGPGKARMLTTDLTPAYVEFNGERS